MFILCLLSLTLHPHLIHCDSNMTTVPSAETPATSSPISNTLAPLASAVNDFSVSLFHQLSQENQQDNVFVSPLSVSTAMSILLLGARTKSAEDLSKGLKFDQVNSLTGRTVHELFHDLITSRINNGTSVSLSNYLLIQKEAADNAVLNAYKKQVSVLYDAQVDDVIFASDGEKIKTNVNKWVSEKTNNMIKSMLDQAPGADVTALILNAIYFKGKWEQPFSAYLTQKEKFYNQGVNEKEADFMTRTRKRFSYAEAVVSGQEVQVLEMPYTDDDMAMVMILPKEKNDSLSRILQSGTFSTDFRSLIANLTSGSFLQRRLLNLYLPKFRLETDYSLIPTLTRMGISDVFDREQADLSGMTGRKNLFVSGIRHKAVVTVDEDGTEAAASTMIEVSRKSGFHSPVPPIEFRADHPFLFLIRDTATGLVYFSGRVEQL